MAYICDDILSQVFAYLPLKSLARFMLLSKSCRDHVGILPMATTGFFYRPETSCDAYSYMSLDELGLSDATYAIVPRLHIGASCNGLLLLTLSNAFYICNPTTRTGKVIPPMPLGKHRESGPTAIDFDPKISPHYRVIQVLWDGFRVFSSETGEWETIMASWTNQHPVKLSASSNAVYAGGSVYVLNQKDKSLMVADLKGKTMRVSTLPSLPDCGHIVGWRYGPPVIGASDGSVYLFYAGWTGFSIWAMKEGVRGELAWELKQCRHDFQLLALCGWDHLTQPRVGLDRLIRPWVVEMDKDKVYIRVGKRLVAYDARVGATKLFELTRLREVPDALGEFWSPLIPYSACFVNPFGAEPFPSRLHAWSLMSDFLYSKYCPHGEN